MIQKRTAIPFAVLLFCYFFSSHLILVSAKGSNKSTHQSTKAAEPQPETTAPVTNTVSLPPQKRETYRDIIEKAQLLSLQKDRQQALLILETALKKEGPKGTAAQELKRQFITISRIFISDRTQNIYELGMSVLPKDLQQGQQKITEALRIEPDNLLLLVSQIRLALAKRDCTMAQGQFAKANLKRFVGYDPEVDLLQAQISFCQKNYADLKAFFGPPDFKRSPLVKYWYAMEIQRCTEERNFARARDLITEVEKLDPNYSEIYFLDWKLGYQAEGASSSVAQKYLMQCKNMSPQSYRIYFLDPNTCANTAEAEKLDQAHQ